ncbi:hypothetical protein HK405_013349 [Cladochytrium tenue]|nr:hypothetical protein HK405_013349 [Cladochytrium tenue]
MPSVVEACSSCAAIGFRPCRPCGGSGRRACDGCDGSGRIVRPRHSTTETCSACASTASKGSTGASTSKPRCTATTTTDCENCRGTGRRRCTSCTGTGRASCTDCDGAGSVIATLVVNVHRYVRAAARVYVRVLAAPGDSLTAIPATEYDDPAFVSPTSAAARWRRRGNRGLPDAAGDADWPEVDADVVGIVSAGHVPMSTIWQRDELTSRGDDGTPVLLQPAVRVDAAAALAFAAAKPDANGDDDADDGRPVASGHGGIAFFSDDEDDDEDVVDTTPRLVATLASRAELRQGVVYRAACAVPPTGGSRARFRGYFADTTLQHGGGGGDGGGWAGSGVDVAGLVGYPGLARAYVGLAAAATAATVAAVASIVGIVAFVARRRG